MTPNITYQRLQLARSIIAALNETNLFLGNWVKVQTAAFVDSKVEPDCNTIACAAGWLGMTEEFRKLGFKIGLDGYGYVPIFLNPTDPQTSSYTFWNMSAISRLFIINYNDAVYLFGPRQERERRAENQNLSDKQIWLNRVDTYLTIYFDANGSPSNHFPVPAFAVPAFASNSGEEL